MKQEIGIMITPTSCIPVPHGSYAAAATSMARARVPSFCTATMVMPTTAARGVGFWWRDSTKCLLLANGKIEQSIIITSALKLSYIVCPFCLFFVGRDTAIVAFRRLDKNGIKQYA